MRIGVVIPTRDRRQNLDSLLTSLRYQTLQGFAVVVADDGSTDGTREMVERHVSDPSWGCDLRWVGCGPSGGRRARARNIGMANLPAGNSLVVMLDSDLILQPTAIEQFAALHVKHPKDVLLGPVDRLPPMEAAKIISYITAGDIIGLRGLVPNEYSVSIPLASDPGKLEVGPDYRPGFFLGEAGRPVPMVRYGPVNNNAGWPLSTVCSLGGFDECMQGWGHEDLEFGARAANKGTKCVFQPELWALHVWHAQPARSGYEWQRNLDYYIRRHGDLELEILADWSLWFHYHSERAGCVLRCRDQLWALNRARTDRICLPDQSWLRRLGHCGHEIQVVSPDELAFLVDHGLATDWPEPG